MVSAADEVAIKARQALQEILASKTFDHPARQVLFDLVMEMQDHEHPLEDSHMRELRECVLDLLGTHRTASFGALVLILSHGGAKGYPLDELETSLEVDPSTPRPGKEHHVSIQLSILDEAGVFEESERLLYWDYGGMHIKDKDSGRRGIIFLTDRCVFVFGTFGAIFDKTDRRLLYNDWEGKQYLTSLDYLYLADLLRIEHKKDQVKVRVHAKYVEEKKRTLYGPYFFTFDLPKTAKVRVGEVDISIKPKRPGSWYDEEFKQSVPRDDHHRRAGVLYARMTQLIEQIKSDDATGDV
ncbi:MAG: hypothetical protein ACFFC0_02295 [Promethearchaeota archaeon]